MIDRRVFSRLGSPVRLKWLILGWLVGEVLVFVALVKAIGFGGTVLLGLATTVLGIVMMRRLGTTALLGLRDVAGGRQPAQGALADGMLGAFGAMLLVLPGFLANAVGLALAAPSIRHRTIRALNGAGEADGPRPRPSPPGVIDLGPADWRVVDRS